MLVASAAAAIPATGDLTLRGALHFDAPADATLRTLAFVDNAPEQWGDFNATMPRAEVCAREQREAEATIAGNTFHTLMPNGRDHSCANLTSVRVGLAPGGTHKGWLALDTGRVRGVLDATMKNLTPNADSVIASEDARNAAGNIEGPEQPFFRKELNEAHLRTIVSGVIEYDGAACLKVKGPDFRVESDQGTTVYTTDDGTGSGAPARERITRWLVIWFPDGGVRFTTSGLVDVAAESAPRVAWNGNATLTAESGALRAFGGTFNAPRAPAWLDGDFTAILAPTADGAGMLARIDGDVRATSLRYVPAAEGPRMVPAGLGVLGFAIVGAVVMFGVSAAVVVKRRRAQVDVRPAVLLADLHTAEDEDRPREAADILWRLRRAEPVSVENVRRVVQEAIYRRRLKDYQGALSALDEAMRTTTSGHAEWWAVTVALEWGAVDLAESYLVQGLMRATDPAWLALLIMGAETAFAPLVESQDVRAALREATARAERITAAEMPAA